MTASREKSTDEYDVYIAIQQSLSLNDLLWVILTATVDIFNKIVS